MPHVEYDPIRAGEPDFAKLFARFVFLPRLSRQRDGVSDWQLKTYAFPER
jgi:hypothetical protein